MSSPRFSFLDRYFFASFAFALIAVVLAYQFRLPFSLDVGGPIDQPLLVWVHDPQLDKATGIRYRWTTGGSELYIRDWGAGNPVALRMRVTRFKPPNDIADLTLFVNGLEFAEPMASGQGWQEYTLQITDPRFLANDDLDVKFATDTFIPKNEIPGSPDPRRLGIQISLIKLIPLQYEKGGWHSIDGLVWSPTSLPPYDLAFYFVASALALYVVVGVFEFPRIYALIVSFLFSVCAAIALVWVRPYITLFAGTFFITLVASILVGLLARAVASRLFAWGGVHAGDWEMNVLALTFAFAFLVKLDFLLYPQTISFDLLYHLHRLLGVLQGDIYWTHQSTQDIFGGLLVPYQPSLYIFLSPLAALGASNSNYLQLLIELVGVLSESLPIFVLFFWLKKYFQDGRAGLIAAWVYVAIPLGSIELSMGIYPDLLGQFATLVLLVALIEGLGKLTSPGVFVLVTLLIALALVAHAGVLVSLVPLFGVWFLLVFGIPRQWRTGIFYALAGCITAASFIAFVLYYSDFVPLLFRGNLAIGTASDGPASGGIVRNLSLWQLLQPARTEFTAVHPYVYLSALLGLCALVYTSWRAPTQGRFLLITLLTAWSIAFAVLLLMRALFGFSPRYVSFVMPAIAVCAGAAWSWLSARRWIGRVAVSALLLTLTAQGAYHWFVMAMFKYH